MFEIIILTLLVILFISGRKSGERIKQLEIELDTLKKQFATGGIGIQQAIAPETAAAAHEAIEQVPETLESPAPDAPPRDYAPREEELAATVAEVPVPVGPAVIAPVRESLESRLGARWAVWAGGLALALGGIFLVRYTIESGLLGPGVRLMLAALFGLLLIGAGEAIRRRILPDNGALYANAMIPGVLTAAGTLSLFGTVYAAHAFYGFIGTAAAFVLLALIAFATLGLSLLHGQALAGLGLLGSMLIPALVSSQSGNIPVLFGFLTLSLLATSLASRLRGWTTVPALANLGMGLWALLYVLSITDFLLVPPALALLAMIAITLFIWPARAFDSVEDGGGTDRASLLRLAGRCPRFISISVSIAAALPAVVILLPYATPERAFAMTAIIGALSALGASRHYAVWPAVFSALGALAGVSLLSGTSVTMVQSLLDPLAPAIVNGATNDGLNVGISLLTASIFVLTGFAFLKRKSAPDPAFAMLHAAIIAVIPVWIATTSFLQYGNFSRDWTHGIYATALGILLLAGTEWLARQEKQPQPEVQNLLVTGSFAAFALALHTLTSGLVTTVGLSVIGFAYVLAAGKSNRQAMPWMMALASVGVLARIAWEPTIVGQQNLGTTPVFNALLPGYGIPAILAILSAWQLRDWPGVRIRNFLQAIASLMGLLTLSILVRHAMNDGVLEGNATTLGEQSIYTLLTVGFSGVLMTLDLRSPSPVFRYGSMIAGVIAMINIITLHFGAFNPYFSGENTGPWPLFNLLLIGYLLPGIAYAGLAFYARGKRPAPYVVALALCGAALGFAWATLSVRRFWQGENIAAWKGFIQGETYTYSVVWLAIGVALLVLGSKLDARSLRLASAGLVLISVAKVFLIDMSHLEGVLRAVSFIGLGVVLIGIGLFYQKILGREAVPATQQDDGSRI